MHLLVLGATGRTGGHVVTAAKAAGHHVTAFGRRPADGVDANLTGAFGDAAFADAVRDADATLSCLASSNSDPVCSTAMEAALAADTNVRYLTIAGAGVDRPEDEKGVPDKMIGLVMKLVVGKMLADRQHEIDTLAGSDARWTALRPPRLVEGKATGRWRFSFDKPRANWIDRKDLAAAMLAALEDEALVGRAPFVSADS